MIPFSLLIGSAASSAAQQPIEVTMMTPQAQDPQPYFSVDIHRISIDQVRRDWKNYIEKGSSGDGNLINGEYIQTGVVNKSISADPFTAYAGFNQSAESVNLKVWLKQNNTAFGMGENTEAVKKFVRDFAVAEYRKGTTEILKNEQAKLDGMEGELASLNKADDKSIRDSERNNRSNERSEETITSNQTAIDNSATKIESQENMIDQTGTDENANSGAKKTMKEIESEKKELQKKNEKESRRIDDRNEKNRASDRKRTISQQDRTRMEAEIEDQKTVVYNLQQELNNIN